MGTLACLDSCTCAHVFHSCAASTLRLGGLWRYVSCLSHKVAHGVACRPEVCRTYNFGERGASKGFFFRRFLLPILLNDVDVPWASLDLSYLDPGPYAAYMNATLAAAPAVSVHQAMQAWPPLCFLPWAGSCTVRSSRFAPSCSALGFRHPARLRHWALARLQGLPATPGCCARQASGDVKVLYSSQEHYEAITAKLHMMREWKDGVPRCLLVLSLLCLATSVLHLVHVADKGPLNTCCALVQGRI